MVAVRGTESLRQVLLPTLAMTTVLSACSLAIFSVAVFAPVAAPDMGVAETAIGIFSALTYFCGMVSGVFTGSLTARYGPIRVSQWALLAVAVGMLLMTLAQPLTGLLCAVCIGLGYGTLNPASALVLTAVASPRWRALVFSLKQIGVPIGGMLAGMLVPMLVVSLGWRFAAYLVALLALGVMLLIQPLRQGFDRQPLEGGRSGLLGTLQLISRQPALTGLAVVGLAYGGTQVSTGAFFVVFLVSRDISLVQAGMVFLALQAGGVLGRLFWGWCGGVLAPRLLLSMVGLGAALATGLLLQLEAHTPAWWRLPLGFLLGMCSFGWNGLFLAEVARAAPPGRVSEATGGVQVFMFGGVLLLPPLVGALVQLGGGYQAGFMALILVYLLASMYLLLGFRGGSRL